MVLSEEKQNFTEETRRRKEYQSGDGSSVRSRNDTGTLAWTLRTPVVVSTPHQTGFTDLSEDRGPYVCTSSFD